MALWRKVELKFFLQNEIFEMIIVKVLDVEIFNIETYVDTSFLKSIYVVQWIDKQLF